jgi:hypothetical protein
MINGHATTAQDSPSRVTDSQLTEGVPQLPDPSLWEIHILVAEDDQFVRTPPKCVVVSLRCGNKMFLDYNFMSMHSAQARRDQEIAFENLAVIHSHHERDFRIQNTFMTIHH